MPNNISVYIPCYNGAHFLPDCIESLTRQTRAPDEIIVVDDGSTDGSGEVAEQLGARVLRQPTNMGLGAGRNRAMQEASHDLVASLDADCIADPDWLGELERALLADDAGDAGAAGTLAGVGGRLTEGFQSTAPDAWRTRHMPQHWGDAPLTEPPLLFGNNNLFRRDAVLEVGGYDKKLRTNYEDVDMSHRLLAKGYRIFYEPKAHVTHQRRDSVRSVLNAYWRWTLWDYAEPTTMVVAARKSYFNARKAASFLRHDYRAGQFRILPLDMLLCMMHTYWDFRHVQRMRSEA